jgi:hypothetical protein
VVVAIMPVGPRLRAVPEGEVDLVIELVARTAVATVTPAMMTSVGLIMM